MLMRVPRTATALIFLVLALPASADFAACSWNAKRLSTDDYDRHWGFTASALDFCDVAAVQEVMDEAAAVRLQAELEKRSKVAWGLLLSAQPVGRSRYKESYAILYRKGMFAETGRAVSFLDPEDHFEREPFAVELQRHGGLSYVFATVHVIYGTDPSRRRAEVQSLGAYAEWLRAEFAKSSSLVLLGDFNVDTNGAEFEVLEGMSAAVRNTPTTLGVMDNQFVSAYDNIFVDQSVSVINGFIDNIVRRFGLPNWKVRKQVSDHAPVVAIISE